jgi:hypothetical protein
LQKKIAKNRPKARKLNIFFFRKKKVKNVQASREIREKQPGKAGKFKMDNR